MYQDKAGVKQLSTYLSNKCPKKNETMNKAVKKILSLSTDKHVGWVVSERFINMPVEIMAPMYTMLQEEIKKAVVAVRDLAFSTTIYANSILKLERALRI